MTDEPHLHLKMSAHWRGVPLTRFVSIILARTNVASVSTGIMEIRQPDASSTVMTVTPMQHARTTIDLKSNVSSGVHALSNDP